MLRLFLLQVNHHFRQNSSVYVEVEHPRWGSIMCVESRRPIKAGEEIFTHYLYKVDNPPNDHPWYFEQLRKIEFEDEEKKRNDKENRKTGKKTKKKKNKNKKSKNSNGK